MQILSETAASDTSAAGTASQTFWEPGSVVLCTIGACILVIWLFWYEGFGALRKTPTRRHHWLLPVWPLSILVVWIFLMVLVQVVIDSLLKTESTSTKEMAGYLPNILLELGLIAAMILAARRLFARGLKGFGLTTRNILLHMRWGIINLLAVLPLITISLWITLRVGQLLKGTEFNLEVHQSLSTLDAAEPILQIAIIAFAALIVPVFEEMLFRGFFQTSLRTLSGKPWIGIILTSSFFAILHPPTHIPALFILSCALGYAYERSGSLLRPILMHILFNGLSVTMTIMDVQ